jgi:hypothetical protein
MSRSNGNQRVSFAKLREPLEVPNLLALQTDSFDWLVGGPAWRARQTEPTPSGLDEILEEISPIEDFSGNLSLSFSDPRFDEVKANEEECRDKDMTYSAPLFVTAEFMNGETGEIKSQTVFMGDFPMMTSKGTFIINGTERVVVSQLVRSPGVYFDKNLDKTAGKDVFSVKVIPSRGAWLEFDIDKRDTIGVRIDRKRRQPVSVLKYTPGDRTSCDTTTRSVPLMMKVPLSVITGKSPMKTVWLLISPVVLLVNSAVTNSGAPYVMSLSRHSSVEAFTSSKRGSEKDSDIDPEKSSIGEISVRISSRPPTGFSSPASIRRWNHASAPTSHSNDWVCTSRRSGTSRGSRIFANVTRVGAPGKFGLAETEVAGV